MHIMRKESLNFVFIQSRTIGLKLIFYGFCDCDELVMNQVNADIGAYVIQCVLLADFMLLYLRSIRRHSVAQMAFRMIQGFTLEVLGAPISPM